MLINQPATTNTDHFRARPPGATSSLTAMRVLVADSFDSSGLDALAKAGCTVTYRPQAKDQALVNEVAAAAPDVLIVRSTKVPEAVLAAGPLKLVVRAGAGYNTIDVAAASRLGIYVSNCPGKNSIAVAELAFALIAALDRRIADNVADLRAGVWNKGEYLSLIHISSGSTRRRAVVFRRVADRDCRRGRPPLQRCGRTAGPPGPAWWR